MVIVQTPRKTRAQLDREIAVALQKRTKPTKTKTATKNRHTKKVGFLELIRDEDPNSMQVAEDFLLENGLKMREATGGLHARNFTIDMKPLYGPSHEWKMVQTNVYEVPSHYGRGKHYPRHNAGTIEIRHSIANGPVRFDYLEKSSNMLDSARKAAVATAWAIAKAIKPLPLDTKRDAVIEIVGDAVHQGLENMSPEELF